LEGDVRLRPRNSPIAASLAVVAFVLRFVRLPLFGRFGAGELVSQNSEALIDGRLTVSLIRAAASDLGGRRRPR
jgi:hypothetical protein